MNKITLLGLLSVFLFISCGKSVFESPDYNGMTEGKIPAPESQHNPNDNNAQSPPVVTPDERPVVIAPELNICSKLDFAAVQWPASLTVNDKNYLALALNITGSFEGMKNWTNLSNNFDGMGISLGIMQQNLGMGSLQPILSEAMALVTQGQIEMDNEKFRLLSAMLRQWKLDMSQSSNQNNLTDELFKDDYLFISELDNQDELGTLAIDFSLNKGSTLINKKSVSWALGELYIDGGKTFRNDWVKSFNTLTSDKAYVGLQLKYSMQLYSKALLYFKSFGLKEIRSFLTMYDFVVQNGGFKKKVQTDFNAFIKANPNKSETEKLLKILELRIKDVLPQWQSDVISRKKTIINSTGVVHGAKRNLGNEYCYDPNGKIVLKP
jgi:hypothetical protein